MANVKITDLTALSGALVGADLFEMVDDVAGTPASRKVTAAVVRDFTNMAQVVGADADTTMAVNTLYVVDMSAWATADRTYTLPATAAVGDRCAVLVTAGDASHELILTAGSGDTLNGIAGGTEWSRVFITGEVVVMRCVAANATWVVEHDGRIPQQCLMRLSTSADGEAALTFTQPTLAATPGAWTADVDVGNIAGASNDRITVRRAGNFDIAYQGIAKDNMAAAKAYTVALYKTGTTNIITAATQVSGASAAITPGPNCNAVVLAQPLAADDYVLYRYRSEDGSVGLLSSASPRTVSGFSVHEVL